MTESHGIKRNLIAWTELKGTALETRVYCKACGASNVVTGNDNAFFFAGQDPFPKAISCDKCRKPILVKLTKYGVEVY